MQSSSFTSIYTQASKDRFYISAYSRPRSKRKYMEDEYYIDRVYLDGHGGYIWRLQSILSTTELFAVCQLIQAALPKGRVCIRRVSEDHSDDASYILSMIIAVLQLQSGRLGKGIRRVSEDHSDDASYILSMIIAVLQLQSGRLGKRF